MQPLDIEQQLRLHQAQQAKAPGAQAVPPLSFLHGTYQAAAQDAVVIFAGIPVLTGLLFLLVPLLARSRAFHKLANGMKTNHQRTGASLLVQHTTPFTFSAAMAAWMVLLSAHTVCAVLREVALQHYTAVRESNASALADLSSLHAIPLHEVHPHLVWGLSPNATASYPPLLRWCMTPTAFIFATQYAGLLCMWCYVLFAGQPLEAGMFGALLAFFPNFYEALLLNGNEPDRWPVWVTLVSFLFSLAALWAFGAPVVRREFRELKRELQKHTNQVLYKDRPEVRDLRLRGGPAARKHKQK